MNRCLTFKFILIICVQVSVSFFIVLTQWKKYRSLVNWLLFASWHLLKSIICFQYKRNTNKQNNGHKHWVYFRTISTELSHLKTRLFFGFNFSCKITSIIRYMFSTSLILYPFDILLCLFIDSKSRAELEKNFNKL